MEKRIDYRRGHTPTRKTPPSWGILSILGSHIQEKVHPRVQDRSGAQDATFPPLEESLQNHHQGLHGDTWGWYVPTCLTPYVVHALVLLFGP